MARSHHVGIQENGGSQSMGKGETRDYATRQALRETQVDK
jgi:hypothetical protein